MISVNNAARLIKRAILANIATDKENVAITPLISGKHGIGKSAIVKTVAKDLGGTCITIEGGTLKEGEITGLPYQYENTQGEAQFKFLPYYAVERIQEQEKLLLSRQVRPSKKTTCSAARRIATRKTTLPLKRKSTCCFRAR